MQPSDAYNDLSSDRLERLCQLIIESRHRVTTTISKKFSKCWWGVSCLAFQNMREELREASSDHAWLQFIDEQGLAFTLLIGAVPIRIQSENDNAKPVMLNERAKLSQLKRQTRLAYEDKFLPECFLRVEVDQPRNSLVQRIVLRRIEDGSQSVLDEWLLYEGTSGQVESIDKNRTREVQDIQPAEFEIASGNQDSSDLEDASAV